MTLRIERCADLAAGGEIKELFLRNDRPHFPEQFDKVYPGSYARGGASWLARDENGVLVGHIAVFPRSFRWRDRVLEAVVFGDLMMAEAHRDFFPAAAVVRTACKDLRKAKAVDFAFTQSIDMAAGVLQAGGLKPAGALRRYVRPLYRLYSAAMWFKTRPSQLHLEHVKQGWEGPLMEAQAAMPGQSYMRGQRTPETYRPRLGIESLGVWEWFVMRPRGERTGPPAAVALTGEYDLTTRTMAIHDLFWDETRTSVESVLQALARGARESGYTKLSISALTPSRYADALKRCGFILRVDSLTFLNLKIGDAELPPIEDWLPTFADGTAW